VLVRQTSAQRDQHQALNTIDLSKMNDDAVNSWMDRHSLYGDGAPHGFDHVIRNTGNFGPEHYFSKGVFPLFGF
jgi:hypothetical protein